MNQRSFPRPSAMSARGQIIERQKWRELLADARATGDAVASGAALTRDQVFSLQRHLFRGAGTTPFPVQGAAARVSVEALTKVAQAFIADGCKSVRLARLVRQLAEELSGIIDDHVQTQADGWRHQFPDD